MCYTDCGADWKADNVWERHYAPPKQASRPIRPRQISDLDRARRIINVWLSFGMVACGNKLSVPDYDAEISKILDREVAEMHVLASSCDATGAARPVSVLSLIMNWDEHAPDAIFDEQCQAGLIDHAGYLQEFDPRVYCLADLIGTHNSENGAVNFRTLYVPRDGLAAERLSKYRVVKQDPGYSHQEAGLSAVLAEVVPARYKNLVFRCQTVVREHDATGRDSARLTADSPRTLSMVRMNRTPAEVAWALD